MVVIAAESEIACMDRNVSTAIYCAAQSDGRF